MAISCYGSSYTQSSLKHKCEQASKFASQKYHIYVSNLDFSWADFCTVCLTAFFLSVHRLTFIFIFFLSLKIFEMAKQRLKRLKDQRIKHQPSDNLRDHAQDKWQGWTLEMGKNVMRDERREWKKLMKYGPTYTWSKIFMLYIPK